MNNYLYDYTVECCITKNWDVLYVASIPSDDIEMDITQYEHCFMITAYCEGLDQLNKALDCILAITCFEPSYVHLIPTFYNFITSAKDYMITHESLYKELGGYALGGSYLKIEAE